MIPVITTRILSRIRSCAGRNSARRSLRRVTRADRGIESIYCDGRFCEKYSAFRLKHPAKIVPRAQFCVFGHGIIETVQKKMWFVGAVLWRARKMPAETYFLSAHTDEANVKVRDGLLDIKTKAGETPEGYEIFQPRG